jgi:serine/threonine-protein kinase
LALPDTIGRYQIVERIGGGAMGTVYRAHDPQIGRTVAVKVLNANDSYVQARFRQEVRTAGTLTHPNIATVYDCGETSGASFIVMEYVEGQTLADALLAPVPLALAHKVRLMQQLCAALDYAHARGVVHRDIKPANLMLDRHGDLKVVDFGIAKAADHGELTRTGSVLGTLAYMSPEQIEGGPIDRRSDIFAVGLVLYELMSSRRAFRGETPSQIIRAILNEQPVGLSERCPELDPAYDRIVTKALQKNPADRYQTLAELAVDLGGIPIAAQPVVGADEPTATLLIDRSSPEVIASSSSGQGLESQPQRRVPWTLYAWAGVASVAAIVVVGTGVRLAQVAFSTSPAATVTSSATTATTTAVSPPETSAPPPARVEPRDVTPETTSTQSAAEPPVVSERQPRPQPKAIDTPVTREPTFMERATAIMARNPGAAELKEAVELFRKACDAGTPLGCIQGGQMYRDNAAVRDLPLAMQLFERGCNAGAPVACTALGREYARGVAVLRDDARAAALYKRACDGEGWFACDDLGRAYQAGRGVTRDESMARTLYRKACDGGAAVGCVDLGLTLVRGVGGPVDEAGAVPLFQRACDGGNIVGCGNLGTAYARGTAVPRDDARAVALYQRACDGGGAPSCAALAGMYINGRSVTRDPARAAVLLERSCDGNHAEGCETLAQRYESGVGVERNMTRAADFRRRANQLRGRGGQDAGTAGGTITNGASPTGVADAGSTGNSVVAGGVVGEVTQPPPPPPPPQSPVRIGGSIKAPQKIKHVPAVYPAVAQSARVQGVVVLEAVIGPDGKVGSARVLRSIPLLDQAALDAVSQWEFTPTLLKGVAVPVIMTVTVSFTLQPAQPKTGAPKK